MASVFLGYLHGGSVSAMFTESLAGMLAYDLLRPEPERVLTGVRGWYSGVNVASGRNGVVEEFLARPDWGPWLLMVDADMYWRPDAVERLLAVADETDRPIVGGLCFAADEAGMYPTLFDLADGPEGAGFYRIRSFPLGGVLQVSGTGAAFLMVHRSVLQRMRERRFSAAFPYFQETEMSGQPVGEDLTFCLRAGMLGYPIHVATTVEIGHVKQTLLTAAKWLQQQGVELGPAAPVAPLHRDVPVTTVGKVPTPDELAGLLRREAVTHVG